MSCIVTMYTYILPQARHLLEKNFIPNKQINDKNYYMYTAIQDMVVMADFPVESACCKNMTEKDACYGSMTDLEGVVLVDKSNGNTPGCDKGQHQEKLVPPPVSIYQKIVG